MVEMSGSSGRLTAADVLRRYKDEELPEFCEIPLHDVNQTGNFGDRPIHVACSRGNLEEIAALVHEGADVNAIGELGTTPLHEAVGQGHIGAVKALLEYGASHNKSNDFGMTAFDIAKEQGRIDIARLLGEEGP